MTKDFSSFSSRLGFLRLGWGSETCSDDLMDFNIERWWLSLCFTISLQSLVALVVSLCWGTFFESQNVFFSVAESKKLQNYDNENNMSNGFYGSWATSVIKAEIWELCLALGDENMLGNTARNMCIVPKSWWWTSCFKLKSQSDKTLHNLHNP